MDFGDKIRTLRKDNGYGLNEFAKEIGVSAGYLTGKTSTINIDTLKVLDEKLGLFQHDALFDPSSPFDLKLGRLVGEVKQLHQDQPNAAEYVINNLQIAIQFVRSQT
ncbi:helix-turn-helix domain-containing protein [Alteribacter keqinensis]|uniref:XRE family transcriptional regulator n=1 Tax=Alteribacter keqinensis TaxID=2483800 RepID=A0A3M7TTE9_9BACI|nr:helix-turn-helix transcriptional regulator [Alteribacter keqinensis]RNA68797.1 XRE family transcriptional regulator [Alteribacter keqinensis]